MICTLLTDFGIKDHYVAALKAKLLGVNPDLVLVDISHQIELGGFFSAGFQAKSVCFQFPSQSLHFVSVGTSVKFWYVVCQNQHFVSNSTEVLHLITNKKQIDFVGIVKQPEHFTPSFAAKDFFSSFLKYFCESNERGGLLGGTEAKPLSEFEQKNILLLPQISRHHGLITAQVIYVDEFGNLITNLAHEDLENFSFSVEVGIESIHKLSTSYFEKPPGDIIAFFNDLGLLEIAVVYGNASKLLGMKVGSNVILK